MWFEILPSFGIIMGVLSLPGVGLYYLHKAVNGNPYKRNVDLPDDRFLYLRDARVGGRNNPYVLKGLESIPDE